ncbi:hypothetical protein D3C87_1578760 [compost metagenome]
MIAPAEQATYVRQAHMRTELADGVHRDLTRPNLIAARARGTEPIKRHAVALGHEVRHGAGCNADAHAARPAASSARRSKQRRTVLVEQFMIAEAAAWVISPFSTRARVL